MDDLISSIRNNDPTLKELDLRGFSWYHNFVQAIEALKYNRIVRRLNLSDGKIRSNEIQALANSLRYNNTLNRLYLNNVRFTSEDAIALAKAIDRPDCNVTRIYFNYTEFTIEGIRAFARVVALRNRPNIYGIGIDVEVIRAIIRIKHENARAAVRAYLMAGRRRLLPGQNRDTIRKVAEELWATRDEDVWLFDREGVPSAPKKQRTADSCIGCFIGVPLFHEQHDDTRRFCSSYCQFIHHHNLPDLRGMTPSQIESLIY